MRAFARIESSESLNNSFEDSDGSPESPDKTPESLEESPEPLHVPVICENSESSETAGLCENTESPETVGLCESAESSETAGSYENAVSEGASVEIETPKSAVNSLAEAPSPFEIFRKLPGPRQKSLEKSLEKVEKELSLRSVPKVKPKPKKQKLESFPNPEEKQVPKRMERAKPKSLWMKSF